MRNLAGQARWLPSPAAFGRSRWYWWLPLLDAFVTNDGIHRYPPKAFLPILLTLTACGYHVGNQVNLLPKEIHTIAIPAWGNATTQYKIAGFMAEAVTREMITRTRYTIVADPSKADATLTGAIANMFSSATTYDPVTNRTTGGQIVVQMQVRLVAKDGKVLFDRPHLEFRDRYEVSVNPGQFLDESQSTLQRMSRDAARDIVSAVLENF